MADSTGPMLAVGGVTFVNSTVLNGGPPDFRALIGAGFAAGALALVERASRDVAVGVAWIALVTVVFVRVTPGVPAPVETLLRYWNKGGAQQ